MWHSTYGHLQLSQEAPIVTRKCPGWRLWALWAQLPGSALTASLLIYTWLWGDPVMGTGLSALLLGTEKVKAGFLPV